MRLWYLKAGTVPAPRLRCRRVTRFLVLRLLVVGRRRWPGAEVHTGAQNTMEFPIGPQVDSAVLATQKAPIVAHQADIFGADLVARCADVKLLQLLVEQLAQTRFGRLVHPAHLMARLRVRADHWVRMDIGRVLDRAHRLRGTDL